MIQFIILLLKFNIAIMALWLFYKLLLEHLTFFVSVRFFLLSGILVSALISLIQVEWLDSFFAAQAESDATARYIPSLQWFADKQLLFTTLTLVAYSIGALLFVGNLLIQYVSYRKLKKCARPTEVNGEKIFVASKDILPFSFGNSVFVSEKIIAHPEIGQILSHEFIHIRQKHSIDIFLAELVKIIGWFNPFAWLLKRAINQNLEFLTDAELLGSGIDKKSYQYLLLQFSGNRSFSLVTNFNFYSLKTRISKMNQNKSNQMQYARFLLFAPLVLMLMLVFSCMNEQTTDVEPKSEKLGKDAVIELKSGLNDRVGKLNLLSKTVPDKNQSLLLKKTELNDAVYELKLDKKSMSELNLSLEKAEALGQLPPPPPPLPRK